MRLARPIIQSIRKNQPNKQDTNTQTNQPEKSNIINSALFIITYHREQGHQHIQQETRAEEDIGITLMDPIQTKEINYKRTKSSMKLLVMSSSIIQNFSPEDMSLKERLIGYQLLSNKISKTFLETPMFTNSVVIGRNISGLSRTGRGTLYSICDFMFQKAIFHIISKL